MRRSTVQAGLKLIIAAVVSIILAAFFHEYVAAFLFLSPDGETQYIYLGLFWGGLFGFFGIAVTFVGLLRAPQGGYAASLWKPAAILAALVLLFIILLFSSFNAPEPPKLRPGETITI
jgi:hypothetical protein